MMKKQKEAEGESLSFQELADQVGVSSRTKIKKMLKGEINIPKSTLENFCQYLELNSNEERFLNMLRVFNESTDAEMSLSFYGKIIEMRKKHLPEMDMFEIGEVQHRLLEKWYYLPVLSFLGLREKGSSDDLFQIVKAFRGQLSMDEVVESIRVLVQIKLLKYTEAGALVNTHSSVSLLDGLPRPLVRKFHEHMISKALDSINGMPQEKRQLMSATLTIKEAMLPEIKETISNFMIKLHNDYAVSGGDSLYQMNTQLFNIARLNN